MRALLLISLSALLLQTAAASAHHSDEYKQRQAEFIRENIESIKCLALNLYHEARSEGSTGMQLVADVTINRVRSSRFPNSICQVVYDRKQFSWTHTISNSTPRNKTAWKRAVRISLTTLWKHSNGTYNRLTSADHYFADYIERPVWVSGMKFVGKHGSHLFYKSR